MMFGCAALNSPAPPSNHTRNQRVMGEALGSREWRSNLNRLQLDVSRLKKTPRDRTLSPMPPILARAVLGLALLIGAEIQAQQAKPAEPLNVMAFNIRYASATGANAWAKRRDGVVKVIADQKADLIGTQEGLYHQLTFMDKELPDHKWIGVGREGGQRGEFMAIFYRSARFEPLETNHFWLSDTPEKIGSASWGNTVKRMVTWVRFLDRRTKKEFYFWNTHFDHRSQNSREKSAELILLPAELLAGEGRLTRR